MNFTLPQIKNLLSKQNPAVVQQAILDNLNCEERVTDVRLKDYEEFIKANVGDDILLYGDRNSWAALHERYFRQKVANADSATFELASTLTHRRGVAEEDWIVRMERIDGAFKDWDAGTSIEKSPIQVLIDWVEKSQRSANIPRPVKRGGLADLGRLLGRPEKPTPSATTQDLFAYWNNTVRKDNRPSFVAFQAELMTDLEKQDWAENYCVRLGLGHYHVGTPITLALMRYQVADVIAAAKAGTACFCAPTVLDSGFFEFFHPSPKGCDWGVAALLNSQLGDEVLASELLHRRIDYKPEHLWRIATINQPKVEDAGLRALRNAHVQRMRRTCERDDFGVVR